MDIASKAYWTHNYGTFRYIDGNRGIDEKHVKDLMKSIKERGYDPTRPIKVNEQMAIIDGQHRLEAARRLSVDIAYVVARDASLEDCIQDNKGQKSWTDVNYINAFSALGDTSYIYMQNLLKQFGAATPTVCYKALRSGSSEAVRNRMLHISQKDYEDAQKALTYATQFLPILNGEVNSHCKHTAYLTALIFCYYCDAIDNDWLKMRMDSNSHKLKKASRVEDAIEVLNVVYNAGARQERRVNMPYEHEKYIQELKEIAHKKGIETKARMKDDNTRGN